jgi:hypothetical protein
VDWIVGGWQTNLTAIVQTGSPFDLSAMNASPGNRPDLIAPIKYPKSISGFWFDPASFANPPIVTGSVSNAATFTRLGTLGRNQVFGPGYKVVNWSVQKNIHLTDKETLELHGDAFNLLNSAEFTNPDGNLGDRGSLVNGSYTGNFGKVLGTEVYSNREIQLAARFTF